MSQTTIKRQKKDETTTDRGQRKGEREDTDISVTHFVIHERGVGWPLLLMGHGLNVEATPNLRELIYGIVLYVNAHVTLQR